MTDIKVGGDGSTQSNPSEAKTSVSPIEDVAAKPNHAVEIVEGKVEAVEVSKHPVSTIPQTEASWADVQRSRSNPWYWAVYLIALLAAVIVPYWLGRRAASNHAAGVMRILSPFSPQGVALVSWAITVVALTLLGLAVVESSVWLWRILFALALAAEQLIGGACLLKFQFWYSTRVVYGSSAAWANAANLGIIAALMAVGVYAVVFVGLLIGIRKDSPLNVLTRSWVSFIFFFCIETAALLVALFIGIPAVA